MNKPHLSVVGSSYGFMFPADWELYKRDPVRGLDEEEVVPKT